jgi:hypothetical protein
MKSRLPAPLVVGPPRRLRRAGVEKGRPAKCRERGQVVDGAGMGQATGRAGDRWPDRLITVTVRVELESNGAKASEGGFRRPPAAEADAAQRTVSLR